jgi:hypothetical protein
MFVFGFLVGLVLVGLAFAILYLSLIDDFTTVFEEATKDRQLSEDNIAAIAHDVSRVVRADMNAGWDALRDELSYLHAGIDTEEAQDDGTGS